MQISVGDKAFVPFITVCHMGGLHEKIFDYMTDAQRQAFCYSHRVRLVYSNAADQKAGMDKKSEE